MQHINLNILDEQTAHKFYVSGLGAVVNKPSTNDRQLHVNVGVSQFHLLLKYSAVDAIKPVTAAQVWSGSIELWTKESLDVTESRLKGLEKLDVHLERPSKDCLKVRCPWGNQFVLREEIPPFNKSWGSHPSGSGTLASMPRVVHYVRPGAASRLHAFWTTTMGAACELQPSGTPARWSAFDAQRDDPQASAASDGASDGLLQCVVHFNTEPQQLVFAESRSAPSHDAYEHSEAVAYHICVYHPDEEGFRACFDACDAAGLLYANPVFARSPPQFGNALTWEAVEACGQFRIKDLGGGGHSKEAAALVLELEIRSPKHVSCPLGKQPVAQSGAYDANGSKKRARE